jgi:hypothetical protein
LPPASTLLPCLTYSLLKTEAKCASESSVDFQRTEWRYLPHDHRCEILNSYMKTWSLKQGSPGRTNRLLPLVQGPHTKRCRQFFVAAGTCLRSHCFPLKEQRPTPTPWPESASELYRPSDRRFSAKLVPTFADRGVSRSQRGGSLTAVISDFWTGAATFSHQVAP